MAGDPRPLGGRDLVGLGGLLAGCVVGWTGVGLLVDYWAGCSPIGVVVGVGVGMASAAIGFVVRVRQALGVSGDQR